MALIFSELTPEEQVTAIFVGYYDRAPAVPGLNAYVADFAAGQTPADVARSFVMQDETLALYPTLAEDEISEADAIALVTDIFNNLFNRDPSNIGPDNFWVNKLLTEEGVEVGQIILDIMSGAQGDDLAVLQNKIDVGVAYVEAAIAAGEDGTGALKDTILDGVDGTQESVATAIATITAEFPVDPAGEGFTLTQRADDLTGTDADDVFSAPVTQNETGSGELANTFETGDVINGGEGVDSLEATTIASGAISGAGIVTPPITATTNSVENVFLTAQQLNLVDAATNPSPFLGVTIDAQNMQGVEQWWSDNSRADILVEDIRSNPADTAFGMRSTDPGVSFSSYFNASFLNGGVELGKSAFNFTIREAGAPGNEINDITVIGVRFDLNGESFELAGADVEAANTWAELETALQAQLDATTGLEELTVTHEGNGQFTVTDPNSGDFVIDPAGTVITSSTTTEVKEASLGAADIIDLPTETNIFLDDAGNGSQGGAMDVGVMSGDRGVEIFNTTVLSDSHITGLQSSNLRTGDQYLEEVLIEGTGDLTVGNTDNDLDRAFNGLINVRVVDASNLDGSLNAGITLNFNAESRYLDGAEEPVEFQYTGTANNDKLNIFVDSDLSGDPDFTMQVNAGDGDDLINLTNSFDLERVSLDGGEGRDILESASDIGLDDESTPAAFAGIEELVLIGGDDPSADMDALPGVESVKIATDGNEDSEILNLAADTTLTISGERQTLGDNNSNDDQDFDDITLTDAKAQSQVINLENTARVDGVLEVDELNIEGDDSAVRELTLDSGGRRETSNVVNNISAALVTNLVVTGTQALAAEVDLIGQDSDGDGVEFAISGEALGGDFDLTLDEDNVTLSNGESEDVTLTGSDGENDSLTLDGGTDADITSDTTVTEFETVQFGSSVDGGSSSFGGAVDVVNFSDVELFFLQNLANTTTLTNLKDGASVDISDWRADNSDIILEGQGSGIINVQLLNEVNDFGASDDLDWDGGNDVSVSGFDTVNLALDNEEDFDETVNLDLLLDNQVDNATLGTPLVLTGDAANFTGTVWVVDDIVDSLVITGGNADDDDQLALTGPGYELPASMNVIDVSGFAGDFTASLGNAIIEDPNSAGDGISANSDTRFILTDENADITLTDWDAAGADVPDSGVDFNSIFEFTAGGDVTWEINEFVYEASTLGVSIPASEIDNYSLLDVSDLGIESFAELDFTAGDVYGATNNGTTYGAGDVVITSEVDPTWEIVLVGVTEAQLGAAENFVFA